MTRRRRPAAGRPQRERPPSAQRQALAQGELNTLGDPDRFRLRREEILEELERRRGEQEALTLALDGLAQANGELQARFSPELNRAAGEILSRLTGGKYGQVSLTRQFEALAAQAGGLTPRRALTPVPGHGGSALPGGAPCGVPAGAARTTTPSPWCWTTRWPISTIPAWGWRWIT